LNLVLGRGPDSSLSRQLQVVFRLCSKAYLPFRRTEAVDSTGLQFRTFLATTAVAPSFERTPELGMARRLRPSLAPPPRSTNSWTLIRPGSRTQPSRRHSRRSPRSGNSRLAVRPPWSRGRTTARRATAGAAASRAKWRWSPPRTAALAERSAALDVPGRWQV
jgi:hypothetical protein